MYQPQALNPAVIESPSAAITSGTGDTGAAPEPDSTTTAASKGVIMATKVEITHAAHHAINATPAVSEPTSYHRLTRHIR